jgi:integrase
MASGLFKVTVIQYWLYDAWVGPDRLPCAKGTPGARFVKSRKVPKGTPGAVKVKKRSGKWYGRAPGSTKPTPLSANKVAAQQLLAELVRKAELGRAGISDPFEGQRGRPLSEHLDDYHRELQARNNDPRYVSMTVSRIRSLLHGCRFVFTADLSASQVMNWLADLRAKGRPRIALDPSKPLYTQREVADLLGIKPASAGTAVRRNRLDAVGEGKARRYPRATVEALQDRLCKGAGVETSNQYLRAVQSFCRWLVKDRRAGDNPLAHLETSNADVDRRHDRRELTADELRQLLRVTRESDRSFRSLTGRDRYVLYAVACATGFRAAALASLTPESFALDADMPTVTLAARRNKSRRVKEQPLPPDIAELLREYLGDKPTGLPVWGGTWAKDRKGAEMLRLDLELADIPYSIEGPDGPLFADFHALRHTYLTLGGRAGIDLRTLQELAGHSTPTLTARYSHRRLHDLAGAVGKLPRFLPEEDQPQGEAFAATGTDGSRRDPVCTGFAQPADTQGVRVRLIDTPGAVVGGGAASPNPLPTARVEASCDSVRLFEGRVGEGTRTPDIQSHSLKCRGRKAVCLRMIRLNPGPGCTLVAQRRTPHQAWPA